MKKNIILNAVVILISSLLTQVKGQIIFSNQLPVITSNIKTSFTSAEYIYGSVDLGGKTIKEYFKIPDRKYNDEHYYLYYSLEIKIGEAWPKTNSWNRTLIKDADINKTVLHFDVLPAPAKATTVLSGDPKFNYGLASGPLYQMVGQQVFKENGTYSIKVRIYYKSLDAYGNEEPQGKWPQCSGSFSFSFNEADLTALLKNSKEADALVTESAFVIDKLPKEFFGSKTSDPKVTAAKLAAILKRDLPSRTILKFAIGEGNGVLWGIEKNDLGIPRYRYFIPHIHVAYKINGKCYVGTVELIEDYQGGGRYGPLKVGPSSSSNTNEPSIDCGKVK
ncbi:MAG: hypothetical protein ABIR78_07450 [Ferruginibacter sp.]